MRVFIFGINSFVGRGIAKYLINEGVEVGGTYRRNPPDLGASIFLLKYEIGATINVEFLKAYNWIIHCAFDFSEKNSNVSGIQKLLENIAQYSQARHIFISSLSANEFAISSYGRSKYELEKTFERSGHYVVRPGLVIGPGGIFDKIYKTIKKSPILPVIGSGAAPIFFIGADRLISCILRIIQTVPKQKVFNLCSEKPTNQIALAKAIKQYNRGIFCFVKLPISFFEIAIKLCEFIGISPPISRENLAGYKVNTNLNYHSDIRVLGLGVDEDLPNVLAENFSENSTLNHSR
jgi:NADH dehydrogenase